ncbi:MAG: DUF4139 domain-containing protein, partial [Dinghuibacter sp.]|nr:DUF4139 domain-containing protein [Dinghuibacter sp.]
MKRLFPAIFLLVMAIMLNPVTASAQSDDTVRASATIKTASVYFGYGAELSHESKARVGTGTRIIVINNLSTSADVNSLQISVPEHVALLSQRYIVFQPPTPVAGKTRETERMEDSIETIQKEVSRIENLVAIDKEILAKTGLLIETTISTSGNKTVLSAEVLKLLEFYNARIEKSRTNIYNNQMEINRQNKLIAGIRKRIAEAGASATPVIQKPYGQVILQVMCKQAGEIPINLSYYTARAGWTAIYDVRANSKTNKVKLVYKASLTQNTGIDWNKAKLVLSTGTPNFGVTAPILTPWNLQLYVPGLYNDLQRRAAAGNAQRNIIQSFNNDMNMAEVVVTNANGQYKTKQVEEKTVDPSNVEQYTTLNEGQLNTSYEIDLPYDIASDGQLNSVTIKEEEITCTMKNYAVPRADKEAYLLAEIPDWQNLDLLPGDANIIMDDTYIGRSTIDPNTTADTL